MCRQFDYTTSDFYALLARICLLNMWKLKQFCFIHPPVGSDSVTFPVKITPCAQGQPLGDFRKWRISGTGPGDVVFSKWTLSDASSCRQTATSVTGIEFGTVVC